jgi:hypothetical protein
MALWVAEARYTGPGGKDVLYCLLLLKFYIKGDSWRRIGIARTNLGPYNADYNRLAVEPKS